MTGTKRGTGWLLLIVGLVVGTIVAAGLGTWQLTEKNKPAPMLVADEPDARQEVLEVASTTVEKILSYDPTITEDDVSSTAALLTGKAQETYRESMRSPLAIASFNGVTQTTTVAKAGIESLSADKAQVLAFVDQKTASTGNQTQRETKFAVRLGATKVNGAWLIESFERL